MRMDEDVFKERRAMRWNCVMWIGCVAAAAVLTGCGGQASMATWQQSVEDYYWNQANGDMAELRHVGSDDAGTFATLGHSDPERSVDKVGVLVGPVQSAGETWLVFMVGTVNGFELQALEPAAMTRRGEAVTWHVGRSDAQAMAQYGSGGTLERGWPRPGDAFELRPASGGVAVVDHRTGARWMLELPAGGGEAAQQAVAAQHP
jgi:hypothetical protein